MVKGNFIVVLLLDYFHFLKVRSDFHDSVLDVVLENFGFFLYFFFHEQILLFGLIFSKELFVFFNENFMIFSLSDFLSVDFVNFVMFLLKLLVFYVELFNLFGEISLF